MNVLASSIMVSLGSSFCATLMCAGVGIPLACILAFTAFPGKKILLSILNTLLAVPTVVIGLLVYTIIRSEGVLGPFRLLFTPGAIVLGQFVLALPIMVIMTHSALYALDSVAMQTARSLGATRLSAAKTMVREGKFGIFSAVTATFGRLIGEVGISMMLGGNIAGYTRTMTTSIALETSQGAFGVAMLLGGVLLTVALGVNMLLHLLKEKAG